MREIKFRAWDTIRKRWRDDWSLSEYTVVLDLQKAQDYHPGLVYCQYTGLKDKNGKEIYEGDVVAGFGAKDMAIIRWSEPESCFRAEDLHGNHYHAQEWSDDFAEVIGNIYENPELLK